jgi:hypothetical protein
VRRPTPSSAARVRQDAGPIRHSVGGKEANGQISPVCCNSDTHSIAEVACNPLHYHDFTPGRPLTFHVGPYAQREALAQATIFPRSALNGNQGAAFGSPRLCWLVIHRFAKIAQSLSDFATLERGEGCRTVFNLINDPQ